MREENYIALVRGVFVQNLVLLHGGSGGSVFGKGGRWLAKGGSVCSRSLARNAPYQGLILF